MLPVSGRRAAAAAAPGDPASSPRRDVSGTEFKREGPPGPSVPAARTAPGGSANLGRRQAEGRSCRRGRGEAGWRRDVVVRSSPAGAAGRCYFLLVCGAVGRRLPLCLPPTFGSRRLLQQLVAVNFSARKKSSPLQRKPLTEAARAWVFASMCAGSVWPQHPPPLTPQPRSISISFFKIKVKIPGPPNSLENIIYFNRIWISVLLTAAFFFLPPLPLFPLGFRGGRGSKM